MKELSLKRKKMMKKFKPKDTLGPHFNPNSIGVKYFLIALGGGNFYHVSVLTSLLVNIYIYFFLVEILSICHV